MIDITTWAYDLSRRVILTTIHPFSLREYLHRQKNIALPSLTVEQIVDSHMWVAREYSHLFSYEYLAEYNMFGQFWFDYKQQQYYQQALWNAVKKSLYEDFLAYSDNVISHPRDLEKLLILLCNSVFSEISIHSIAKKLSINDRTASDYVWYLTRLGWLVMMNKYDSSHISTSLRKQPKILVAVTNLICLYNLSHRDSKYVWNMRESFFVSHLMRIVWQERGMYELGYQTKTDFILYNTQKEYYFEVWGQNKKSREDAYVVQDDVLIGREKVIPLWIFGLLA